VGGLGLTTHAVAPPRTQWESPTVRCSIQAAKLTQREANAAHQSTPKNDPYREGSLAAFSLRRLLLSRFPAVCVTQLHGVFQNLFHPGIVTERANCLTPVLVGALSFAHGHL